MPIRRRSESDLVVVGGGLAGTCAALAAARQGLRTVLVHERPVLGGVASSEMRVTVHGAGCHHAWARETGIIAELLAAERAANHETINENGWTNAVFDQALYDACQREPLMTLHLNSPVIDVVPEGAAAVEVPPHTQPGYYQREACAASRRIAAVVARTLSAEVELELHAPCFVDATGDGMIADRAGCAWRMGSESRAEHGEPHAAETASTATMGNSIHIRARDIGRDAPFTAPEWAVRYEDAAFFYEQGRSPRDPHGGFWWIEIGVPWHTIHDNETIRHELTRHALGVWDWMKNRDPVMRERCRTFALDFIGQVPGKRESRRIVGRHWLTEVDLQQRTAFPDAIAHGGWFVDLHTPGGLLAPTSEPAAAEGYRADSEYAASSYIGPYAIPLRSLIARDVDNLFLAGRCLSATRAALGTVRVMGTTALMGQAVGTAAAIARERGLDAAGLADDASVGGPAIRAIQQRLLRDGVFIPNLRNEDPGDLARTARITASSSARVHGLSAEDSAPFADLRGMPGPGAAQAIAAGAAQLVWCGGTLDRLSLCLDHSGTDGADLPLRLAHVEDVWDYRKGGAGVVAETVLRVPPGRDRWLGWDLGLRDLPPGWLRLEAGPAATDLAWRLCHGVLPGHNAFRHLSPTRWRAVHASLAFRVEPAQEAFAASEVLSGVDRPAARTHQWRSDPGAGLPQWVELAWDEVRTIRTIALTFPGQLLGEVHREAPFRVEPQVARDYHLEADGREILRITGNRHWRVVHTLDAPVTVQRLRLTITSTHGAPAAGLCAWRCW